MSVKVMTAVFERYPEGGGEMLLALALADHADDDGTHIFPSVQTMAKKTRQSKRAVQYQLEKMQKSGWLILVRAARGGRPEKGATMGGRPAEYRISSEWIKGAEIAPNNAPAPEQEKGEKSAPNKAVDNSGKGAEIAPNKTGKGCKPRQKRVQSGAEKGAKLLHTKHQLTVIESSAAATNASGDVEKPPAAAANEQKPNVKTESELGELLVGLEAARGKQLALDPTKDRIHLLTWVGKGVTAEQLRAAHALAVAARGRDTDGRPTYVGFVSQFIAEAQGAGGTAPQYDGDWFETGPEIEAKGKALGVRPRKPDEPMPYYLVLVAAAAGKGPWIDHVLSEARRSRSEQFFKFVVDTFGDALLPADFYA
ncbi:helix-turn-helix domain-containing protein [Trinickia dinghuensis]|uniref:Helix-turn-helix domain-containing protein n=1 Tax=Trinickia dinghuensis TaxID=2291023 RepID=A0A3D8K175_9BURK|nr:helix-turn-helix domain-containing protein [Trinickia dinghuensis]RDU99207.1 hypothetical protein DWV00_08765 [Trinickia dinghuensis]